MYVSCMYTHLIEESTVLIACIRIWLFSEIMLYPYNTSLPLYGDDDLYGPYRIAGKFPYFNNIFQDVYVSSLYCKVYFTCCIINLIEVVCGDE